MPMQVKNNTPSAGYIQWSDVSISYKGQVYQIADGSTNYSYVYWKYSDPTSFYGSNTFPTLGEDDLLVFLNKNGTHVKVPTASTVDGSLIVPESILTDALAANSITGDKIRANEINTKHLKAGAVTADILASGVNPNIVRNGYDTFAQIPAGTGNVVKTAGTTFDIVDYPNGLTSGKVLRVNGATGYLAKDVNDFSIPVDAGKLYFVSAYARIDGTTGQFNQTLGLRFNNPANDIYGGSMAVVGNTGWARIVVAVTVPAGATKAMLYVSGNNTVYWDAFMVELADSTQTEASDWKPSGTTVIWGGNIATRSINADRIASKSITANELAANSVTANELAANSVTAVHIASGSVTSDKIAANSITSNMIATQGLDASVIKTGVLDAARVKIGSSTVFDVNYDPSTKETPSGAQAKANAAESNAKEVARAMALGKMLHTDPIFRNGLNGLSVYNLSGGNTVTISRISSPAGTPNTSGYALQIQTTGAPTNPGFGGFTFSTKARANAIFIARIVAKIPVGYTLNWASNATGSGGNATSKWLTPNVGTGKWEEYVYKLVCGDSGTFSTSNYFYLSSGPATFPITWYLAYATVFDVTDNDYMALDTKALTDGWKYPNTTYIDGGNIYTGTITANKIASKSITANEIASGAITANEIASGAITADKMNVNSLSAISANLGNVTAGSMQGVSLSLGGTNNSNGVLVVYNSAGEKVIDIDANDGGFDKLIVGQLICDSVPKINNSDLNFYVDPAGDDSNDGLSWSTPKKTIQACIDLIPKINNGNVTITCKYPPGSNRQDFYGDVILKGFTGAGSITIEGQNWYNYINGKIFSSGCTNRIYIRNFTVNYTDASAGYAVFSNACTYFSCYYIWVYGQNRAGSAFVATEGTNMFLDYCEGYDCNFVINAQKRSDVMVSRCKGYGTQYGLVAQWGSWIMIFSSYPSGDTNPTYFDSAGTISFNSATVNNGAKGTPPPSTTTKQWSTTNGNNWSTMYGWTNDGVKQGNYGYGERTGFYNFGTDISSVLQGKTIKSMRVWVQRKSSGGASGKTPIYVRYHNYTSQPAGQPAMSSAYARIDLAWGEGGWVTLPQAFLDAFSNGSAKGIGLWANSSSYQYYAVMESSCWVEATYQ